MKIDMSTCPECGQKNHPASSYCNRCGHRFPLPPAPNLLDAPTVEALNHRLVKATRRKEIWQFWFATSWMLFLVMFMFCLSAWGLPFGILGFLYLCMYAVPALVAVSIIYICVRRNCSVIKRQLTPVGSRNLEFDPAVQPKQTVFE